MILPRQGNITSGRESCLSNKEFGIGRTSVKVRKRITTDPREEEILACFRGGDSQRGALLLEEVYGPFIRRIVANSKWKFDVWTQQDIRQEVAEAVSRRLPTLDLTAPLCAFVSRVTHNRCVDEVRRKARREVREFLYDDRQSEDGMAFEPRDESEPGPLETIIRNERALMARQLIDGLGEKCSEILSLRYLEDLKYKDIQERLGIPLGTVCKRISDCLERARKRIEEMAEIDDIVE